MLYGRLHRESRPIVQFPIPYVTEGATLKRILGHEKSLAAALCQLRVIHGTQDFALQLSEHVLGIVSLLGRVADENLSRILSEYLGLETMLAVVCKTHDGVRVLETYKQECALDDVSSRLNGLQTGMDLPWDGRTIVICLDNLSPFAGDLIADDLQRRLNLPKPKFHNGECPPGFLGYAVNMINVDSTHLIGVTRDGRGLRETLLYNLSQAYKSTKQV